MTDDLISRSELKKAFEKVYPLATNEMGGVVNKQIYDIIDNAPTVELFCAYLSDGEVRQPCLEAPCKHERPQGEWNYIQADMCVCPFCGAMPHKLYKNYCAKCGAELKGGAE